MGSISMEGRGRTQGWVEGQVECDADLKTALVSPQGTLELEWPFRVVPSWAKMSWPLSLWVGLVRGITLGSVALCSQDSSVTEAVLEGLAARPPNLFSSGFWIVHHRW